MFAYYFGLALHSLRRNPILTALMVLAIGLGIGASMTMITVLHVMTDDPLPGRSAHLYTPHLDPLPLDYASGGGPDPADNLTWPDAMALLKAKRAAHQAAMAGGTMLVRPAQAGLQPFYADGRYATADIFAMFGIRFEYGGGWSEADDADAAHVAVLSDTMARKLFGRADTVGLAAHLGSADYRVIGVVADWAPAPQFYADNTGSQYSDADTFFLPLSVAVGKDLPVSGNQSGWGRDEQAQSGKQGAAMSWLQFWVQLDTSAQVAAYRQYLVDYSAQQKALGRFERPPTNATLYGLMAWLTHQNLVPNDVQLQLWLALGFLFVCMLNIVALLLAKFLRRSGEISVRRALGARRRDIFVQLGVESALIGVAGGMLGLAIAQLGLWSVRHRPDDYAQLAQMDPVMLAGTFALAVFASVLAGLLPAWRACRVTPALQLKAQ
jgi:putative ABC transport system permease protein